MELAEDESHTYVHKGAVGLSRMDDIELSPPTERAKGQTAVAEAEGEGGAEYGNDFVSRRLSVHAVFDDDWNEVGGADGWGTDEPYLRLCQARNSALIRTERQSGREDD